MAVDQTKVVETTKVVTSAVTFVFLDPSEPAGARVAARYVDANPRLDANDAPVFNQFGKPEYDIVRPAGGLVVHDPARIGAELLAISRQFASWVLARAGVAVTEPELDALALDMVQNSEDLHAAVVACTDQLYQESLTGPVAGVHPLL